MSDSDESSRSSSSSDSDEESDQETQTHGKRPAKSRGGGKKKKSKRSGGVNMFLEEEADVDDEEEDEDEYEEGFRKEQYDEEQAAAYAEYDRRRQNRRAWADVDDAALVARFEKESKREKERKVRIQEAGEVVTRNAFLPTVTDPKLFCIKCKPGEERMLCLQLMNKFHFMSRQGNPPRIHSALWSGTKGYIYVEAKNKQYALAALDGLRGVFRSKVTMVPLGEMPAVLRILNQKVVLKVGDFVRLRRYPYKGDLGRVYAMATDGRPVIQCVPRLDVNSYTMDSDQRKAHQKEQRQKKLIPPARFFNPNDFLNVSTEIVQETTYDKIENPKTMLFFDGDYFLDGYLIKETNERMIQTKDVNPTLEELQAFRQGKKGEDQEDEEDADQALEDGTILEQYGNQLRSSGQSGTAASTFKIGDIVVVRSGELEHLKGEVVSVGVDGVIKMNPLEDTVRGNYLDFDANDLMKVFEEGNHVKVRNGRYAGETGTVVKIIEDGEKWKSIVFTDTGGKEIVVFVDDMQISAEIAQARDSLKGYKLHDLISLGTQVGCIVKVGTETLEVLTQTGHVRTITLAEIRGKLNNKSRNTTAMDRMRNTISQNSVVKIVAGENTGIEATVKHIHRSFLFLHSRVRLQNGGILVERARNVQLAGVKLRNMGGMGMMGGGGANATAQTSSFGRGRGRTNAHGRNEDRLLGKTVRVKQGRHKGYIGIVVSGTDDMVKVEIHSKKKIIDIQRDKVVEVGDESGAKPGAYGGAGGGMRMGMGMGGGYSAGGYGMPHQTPYGSATPMRGSETPNQHDAWNPDMGGGGTPGPGTPGPGTPGAGGTWDPDNRHDEEESFRPPPTPAAFNAASAFNMATPAAVPQTPATPAVPKTPAAFHSGYGDDDGANGGLGSEHGFQEGDKIVFIDGPHKGKFAIYKGVDGGDILTSEFVNGQETDKTIITKLSLIKKA